MSRFCFGACPLHLRRLQRQPRAPLQADFTE